MERLFLKKEQIRYLNNLIKVYNEHYRKDGDEIISLLSEDSQYYIEDLIERLPKHIEYDEWHVSKLTMFVDDDGTWAVLYNRLYITQDKVPIYQAIHFCARYELIDSLYSTLCWWYSLGILQFKERKEES